MSETRDATTWVVIGASGFVGSRIVADARSRGITVVELAAPRLEAVPAAAASVRAAAAGAVDVVDELAAAFRGVEVVVNAAGLATPDAEMSASLVGANAVLPLVALAAARRSGARRFVHLSSAAVQGPVPVLDESTRTLPFSPYSQSKAWGEQLLVEARAEGAPDDVTEVVVVRATSVQGPGRPTTDRLRRLAASPLASVASPGDAPTPVTSVAALAEFVTAVGTFDGIVPAVVLQPWEGLTVSSVLEAAGGRSPRRLPRLLCRFVVGSARVVSRLIGGRLAGPIRRVELMWFGQGQTSGWAESVGIRPTPAVADLLRGGDA
ncbi:NAD-dependent epimerase/dehydratase family protein [Frigoribacterium sp. CFBP 8759]|uniref:NAD-dependent epimerase/dehydratase family protein n=1 Tax=Frigoribacterium sp. CFBP 8759 TaxID=2775283 RepID=UPI00177F769A|nr:NAD-dependent epimerase/dehydratase family protein [Frigoribacterium sp. CFBP 8759]MBD8485240.1 NAD-dependent epimerase/dehydratase family protein [Frigoribacterium sp. CFBP 8759]